jgi:hypothetical protein
MHMRRLYVIVLALLFALPLGSVSAYYNITAINTTVLLNSSTGARVIETYSIFISNSSIAQYEASRGAYNLSISDWRNILDSQLLTEHILNPRSGASNVTFLPGALILTPQGAASEIILSYYVYNVTNVQEIAPRKFLYTFNDSMLNFEHTASGQELGPSERFNIIVPEGSQIVSIYPLPDLPAASVTGSYSNDTLFSWNSQEPLNGFTMSYITLQTPQEEVLSYFDALYNNNRQLIYLLGIILLGVFVAYVYLKFVVPE